MSIASSLPKDLPVPHEVLAFTFEYLSLGNIPPPAGKITDRKISDNAHAVALFDSKLPASAKKIPKETVINLTCKLLGFNTPPICSHTLTGHTGSVESASYSPDGSKIVSASSDGTLKIWDAASGSLLHTLAGHTDSVRSASFSPDGSKIVSSSFDGLNIWDAASGSLLHTLADHTVSVRSASFSPDGSKIVSASLGILKIWDAASGSRLHTLTELKSASFSPCGFKIVSASTDDTLKIWDPATGALLHTLTGHIGSVESASYSPDGSKIVSASTDGTLKIWDPARGSLLHTLTGHTGWVKSASFSPCGFKIVSASTDGTLKIWDMSFFDLLPLDEKIHILKESEELLNKMGLEDFDLTLLRKKGEEQRFRQQIFTGMKITSVIATAAFLVHGYKHLKEKNL